MSKKNQNKKSASENSPETIIPTTESQDLTSEKKHAEAMDLEQPSNSDEDKITFSPQTLKKPEEVPEGVDKSSDGDEQNEKKKKVCQPNGDKRKKSDDDKIIVDKILAMVNKYYMDENDEPMVEIKNEDQFERYAVNSKEFEGKLRCMLWRLNRTPLTKSKLKAVRERIETEIYVNETNKSMGRLNHGIRIVPRYDEDGQLTIYYSLNNKKNEAVKISAQGWEIIPEPLFFRRSSHLQPQVCPSKKGNFHLIDNFLAIGDPDEKLLTKVWIIAQFFPRIEKPALFINGVQGSAKSTISKLIHMLVNPSNVDPLTFPGQPDELAKILHQNYLPVFDNLSKISREQSDMLCRAITGGGVLCANSETATPIFKRGMILNSIDAIITRPDLLERTIIIKTKRFENGKYKPEDDLIGEFREALPEILGGVMDIISRVLASISTHGQQVKQHQLPRMAEFTKYVYAIAEEAGLGGENFLRAYNNNIESQNDEVIANNPLTECLVALLNSKPDKRFNESTTTLLDELNKTRGEIGYEKPPRNWPASSSHLARELNKYSVNLKEFGIEYSHSRDNKSTIKSLWMTKQSKLSSLPTPEETPDRPESSPSEPNLIEQGDVSDSVCSKAMSNS